MQAQRQSEERHVDRDETRGKEVWQVDVSHRATRGSKSLRHSCQRTATSISQEDETLADDDSGRDCRSSVLSPL